YYEEKRDNTIIVTLACNQPYSTCICTTVGGDPAGTRGADVLAFDLDNRLYLEGVTEKGGTFLERNGALLKEGAETDREAADALASSARKSMETIGYDRATVKRNLDDKFENPIWEKITNSCIGCGVCTYLCPTCHCFDICDEERHYKGRRIRTWDSCQYAQFTKHASGHNPRPTKTQRLRQRFMHKFSYTVETVDEVYCVGCGRCVRACPVNLDIREVLREFSST
ncbi:MAG: 4Fe-4S dicluster domain-containing protein, partial [Spirochaetia bacterium]